MSTRGAGHLAQTRERLTILLVALATPVIISFLIFLVASAAGATATGLPPVTYGIAGCSAASCSPVTGVTALWIVGTSPGPELPSLLLIAGDGLLLAIVGIVTLMEAIRLVGGLLERRED